MTCQNVSFVIPNVNENNYLELLNIERICSCRRSWHISLSVPLTVASHGQSLIDICCVTVFSCKIIKRCTSTLNSHVSFIDLPPVPTNENWTFEVMSWSNVLKINQNRNYEKKRCTVVMIVRYPWKHFGRSHVHTVKVMLGLENTAQCFLWKDSCIYAGQKPQIFHSYQRSQ